MHYIVFDLEATCWEGAPPNKVQEIIEIGAVKLNPYGEELDSFNRLVKPVVNERLSRYCIELTGIQQQEIQKASRFPEVIEHFMDWVDIFEQDYSLLSWGGKDLELLESDCRLHDIEADWLAPYINLKRQYRDIKSLPKSIGLVNALRKEGYEFDGRHHRGLDDALNLTRLFVKYIDEWAI